VGHRKSAIVSSEEETLTKENREKRNEDKGKGRGLRGHENGIPT
jgi:hypothetical protein